jgi:hypothetical protein
VPRWCACRVRIFASCCVFFLFSCFTQLISKKILLFLFESLKMS